MHRPSWVVAGATDARRLARPVVGWAVILGMIVATLVLVRITGGSPNPVNHLGYVPVLLAAYLFGFRGGAVASIIAGIVLGPVEVALGGTLARADWVTWTTRGAMFLVVGATAGYLFDRTRQTAVRLGTALSDVVERQRAGAVALARAAEARDTTTGEHIFRCRDLSGALALATGMDRDRADDIAWAAMLHDIGKLHVPDTVLLKPGALSAAEWAVMREHPLYGEQILAGGVGFEMARLIARWHHEDWDGGGYPDGLRSDRIPVEARIVRVADAYDAMTHVRPYKAARSPEWAIEELDRFAGSQFDPELVRLFIELLERDEHLRLGRVAPESIAAALPRELAA